MIQILGLILDIIGAFFLFVSTELMNQLVIHLIDYAIKISGHMGDGTEDRIMESSKHAKDKANNYSKWGLVLIALGFLLQLISAIQQYK